MRYTNWLDNLIKLRKFSVPRSLKPPDFGEVIECQIHHFSDASEEAYGAVSYLRFVNSQNQIHCALLHGKSRVVPLKPLSIPRLELCAATICADYESFIRKEFKLPITRSHFWTDSTTVLRYLANTDKRFQTFVANRVSRIRDCSDLGQWRYVPSKLNPADIASRGLSVDKFLDCSLWKLGPEFLWGPENQWPRQPDFLSEVTENDPEVKLNKGCFVTKTTLPEGLAFMENTISRHSDWFKLKKTIAWALRYRGNLLRRTKCPKQKMKIGIKPMLSLNELRQAEWEILRHEQTKYYSSQIRLIANGKPLGHSDTLSNFKPFLAEGLLRIGGRIAAAPIDYDSKHQILIPRDSNVVDLIIKWFHERSGHSGREYVLGMIRENYWIIRPQPKLRKFLSNCVSCRKRLGRPETQLMAELPESRLISDKPPFSYVALDCFGHFNVKRGRNIVKRYGVIFCCLNTKAIHIELVHSLDCDSFIMALERFINRRGQVIEIRSDNGTNFVAGEREIRESIKNWNNNQINETLLQRNVKWIFQTPGASHHGGVFERQIRTVRKVLKAVCQGQTLTDECLLTLMSECESVVNNRPITSVSDDPSDFQPLTPNSLLLLKQEVNLPRGIFSERDNYSRRRWRQAQHLADIFWKRWRVEYLPRLQRRQKWVNNKCNISENDVVLVMDDNLPRNVWLLGRVIEVFPGKDNLIRSVKVKTHNSVLERPITKLVLLHSSTNS